MSFNGKTRYNITASVDSTKEEVEKLAVENEAAARWLDGKTIKKVIVVPGKIVNIVIG